MSKRAIINALMRATRGGKEFGSKIRATSRTAVPTPRSPYEMPTTRRALGIPQMDEKPGVAVSRRPNSLSVVDREFTPVPAMTKAEKRRDLIMRETADLTDSTPFVTRERIWKARSNERTKRIADRARD